MGKSIALILPIASCLYCLLSFYYPQQGGKVINLWILLDVYTLTVCVCYTALKEDPPRKGHY